MGVLTPVPFCSTLDCFLVLSLPCTWDGAVSTEVELVWQPFWSTEHGVPKAIPVLMLTNDRGLINGNETLNGFSSIEVGDWSSLRSSGSESCARFGTNSLLPSAAIIDGAFCVGRTWPKGDNPPLRPAFRWARSITWFETKDPSCWLDVPDVTGKDISSVDPAIRLAEAAAFAGLIQG